MNSQEIGHLVLMRGEHESVLIDGEITVTVEKVFDGKVRLSFFAPKTTGIVRAELVGNGAPRN